MRVKLVALILFCSMTAFSQSYLGSTKKYIAKRYTKMATKDTSYTIKQIDQDTMLIVHVKGVEDIIFEYDFNDLQRCWKTTINYTCNICVESFIEDTFEDKRMGWIQISANDYMSKWFWRIHLTIHYAETEADGAIFVFNKMQNKIEWERLNELYSERTVRYGREYWESQKERFD